jgi:hypothetical protein
LLPEIPTGAPIGAAVVESEEMAGATDSTVSEVLALTLPRVAIMFAAPVPTALASPGVVLLIVATNVFEELHERDAVTSCVLPSEYVPVAASC